MRTFSLFRFEGSLNAKQCGKRVIGFFNSHNYSHDTLRGSYRWNGTLENNETIWARTLETLIPSSSPLLMAFTGKFSHPESNLIFYVTIGGEECGLIDTITPISKMTVKFNVLLDSFTLPMVMDNYEYSENEKRERIDQAKHAYFLMKELFNAIGADWAMGVKEKYFAGYWDPEIERPSFVFSKNEEEQFLNPLFENLNDQTEA